MSIQFVITISALPIGEVEKEELKAGMEGGGGNDVLMCEGHMTIWSTGIPKLIPKYNIITYHEKKYLVIFDG